MWVQRLIVAACLLAIAGLVGAVVVREFPSEMSGAPVEYDCDFSGDPAPLFDMAVPEGFREVEDRPGCLATRVSRCFVTTLDRLETLAFLHGAVGTAPHDNNDGHLLAGWTACGELMGAPAVARISRDPRNAVHTGPGAWRFPREGLVFDGRLTVMILLANRPHCA